MISREQLTALAGVEAAPAISIYLPTHAKGREVRQDPDPVQERHRPGDRAAGRSGVSAPGRRRRCCPRLRRLLDDQEFWRHHGLGLAVFVARDLLQMHKLPQEMPEMQRIGPRPHIKPLLPLLADDGRFYVLTAQADDTRLYVGSRHGLAEVEADIPRSMADVSAETDCESTRHASPPARPRTAGHIGMPASQNFGEDPEEQRKTQFVEHLRRVHSALERHLGGDRAPIVLVGQPEIQGHLRALAKNITFHEEGVQADPDSLDEQQLHARAYGLVQPMFGRSAREGPGPLQGARRLERPARLARAAGDRQRCPVRTGRHAARGRGGRGLGPARCGA